MNAFKGCLSKIRETRMGASLWTDPLGLPGGFLPRDAAMLARSWES